MNGNYTIALIVIIVFALIGASIYYGRRMVESVAQQMYDAKHVVDEERGSESEASVPLAPATVTSAPSDHSHSVQTVQTHTVVTEEATVRVVADE